MIDLSFLTEEEQETIMKVLQRDAELKRAEEERVRHLPEKVNDDVQLKNMSGQWFYEAKSKRHRDKIHGADIIRASMRRKPATLADVSQNTSNKAKSSWVSNVNKEVFVPPELHGIVEHQEEELKSSSSSKPVTSVLDIPDERPMKTAVSPAKQRRNPFNSTASGDNLNSEESENRPAVLPQLSKKEILSPSEDSQPKPNLQNDETEKHKKPSGQPTDESQKGIVKRPVPKARKLIHKAIDPVSEREDFLPKPAKWTERINGVGTPPRGILKRSSSSSSTDSEVRVSQMLDVQKKNGLPSGTIFEGEAEKNSLMEEAEDSTQISLEKLKQVRFSSSTGKGEPLQSPQLHHGRETGEFDLLECDEIKRSGSDAIRSDSFGNKETSAVKPLGTCSSALQVKPADGFREGTLATGPCDTNRSVFLVNETSQTKTVTPEKLETPQKTSSNILPNSSKELSVDETRENKSNPFLSRESKSHKTFTDEHQLSAAHEVSNTTSTSLQQGKPDLVEEQDAKTTFKPDKHADEPTKVANESVSKNLAWFKSSGTEDDKHVSARYQGREPKEEMDFLSRAATEHSGPGMDGNRGVKKELPFGKIKQQNSISPTAFISEDTQLVKERMKPKNGEENEEQNDKSLIEFDCTRVKEREHGQEIKQQNKKSSLLEHQVHKLPAQKCESEKAIQERKRIKEIRAFWERDKTIPSHAGKEDSVTTNASGGSALRGRRESDKIKATAVNLPNRLSDHSKDMLRNAERSCGSQASKNEHQNSFEFGPSHAVEKIQKPLPSDEVHEYAKLPKASNLQPRVGATSASPESKDKDEKETLKGKVAACSQQKPRFQVLSLKEKMNEKPKNQISDPSQFKSLRKFWDTGIKLQNSIDRGDASLPNNANSVTCARKSKEDKKGRENVSKEELIRQQTQTSERKNPQKLGSVLCEPPVGSPALKGVNVTHTKCTDTVQLDRKTVISKPQGKMGLTEEGVKEYIEKGIVSSKEHQVSLQLLQSLGAKDALKEAAVDDWLWSPIGKGENKTVLCSSEGASDVSLPKEEVAETVDKVILHKADLDVFTLGLKRLEKEAPEMSSCLNLKENILKGTDFHSNECKVFEGTVQQSHDTSPADEKEEMSVPSTDEHENKKSLKKLFRKSEPLSLQHQEAGKDDIVNRSQRPQAVLETLLRETFASQPSECRRVEMKTSNDRNSISQTNSSVETTSPKDTGQPEEVNETVE
ncbi:PREDICTED: uncharacterized protein LOC104506889, partial [Eurypyga helias]|uniref:uncharacterized protein LOC104506889 n=1 Tax=Eurypyga helias TaxID=54383 RepID=UPI0005292820